MDILTEALRVVFVVGMVAIPLLFCLSNREATGRNQNQAQTPEGGGKQGAEV